MKNIDYVPADVTFDFTPDFPTLAKTGSVPPHLKEREAWSLYPRERKLLLSRLDYLFACQLAGHYPSLDSDEASLSTVELHALSLDTIPTQIFSRLERVLLQFCDEIAAGAEIPDETLDQYNRILAPSQVIDLVHLVTDYVLLVLSQETSRPQPTRGTPQWQEYC